MVAGAAIAATAMRAKIRQEKDPRGRSRKPRRLSTRSLKKPKVPGKAGVERVGQDAIYLEPSG